MTTEQLRRRVEAIPWFHTIDLPGGIRTPGVDDTRARLGILGLPDDMSGMSVLDVGAWDGFFSFECERRGASRVVACDRYAWHDSSWASKAGFELARSQLGSSVEDVELDIADISPERLGGEFDLVLFLGVLYHLRDPVGGLERVASVTKGKLVLETHVDLALTRRPAAAFYPGRELSNDITNWWGPNQAAVEGMLHAVGFATVETVAGGGRSYRLARAARRAGAALVRSGLRSEIQQGRLVVHASR